MRIEGPTVWVRSLEVKCSYTLQLNSSSHTPLAAGRRTQPRSPNKTPAYKWRFRLLLPEWEVNIHISPPQHPVTAAVPPRTENSRTFRQGDGLGFRCQLVPFQVGVTPSFPSSCFTARHTAVRPGVGTVQGGSRCCVTENTLKKRYEQGLYSDSGTSCDSTWRSNWFLNSYRSFKVYYLSSTHYTNNNIYVCLWYYKSTSSFFNHI